MEYWAKILTNKLIECHIVKEEDKELYTYGFWQGTVFIINFTTVVIVGFLFKMIWQSLIFLTAYGLLRPVTGGYHARTQKRCYILSIILIATVLIVIKWLPWSNLVCLMILVVSTCIVFLLAPVEDENKVLEELERLVYKKRSRIIVTFLLLLAILFIGVGQSLIAYCISISILTSATMLILGKIKNSTRLQ